MPASTAPSADAFTSETPVTSVYWWLLIFGFPANEAAASLAPDLFTHEPPAPTTR